MQDSYELNYSKSFDIRVIDINDSIVDLSNNKISYWDPIGTIIGVLSVSDQNVENVYEF